MCIRDRRYSREFRQIITLTDPTAKTAELTLFLELHGFQFAARSAANILLLRQIFTIGTLHRIVINALLTPSPDLALNAFERLTGVASPEVMAELAGRRKRLAQYILLCGSSPFLVNLMYKSPEIIRRLFLEDGIDLSRSAKGMQGAVQATVDDTTDFTSLQKALRCFKRREIVRIAARDLTGLAPLEETMRELSDLASAALQLAYQVCRRCLIREHGEPLLMEGGETPRAA